MKTLIILSRMLVLIIINQKVKTNLFNAMCVSYGVQENAQTNKKDSLKYSF